MGAEMTDYPMIYSAPMVRALQAGIKTQTRRIITPGNSLFNGGKWSDLHKRQEWDWKGAWVDGGPSPMGNPGPYLKLPWLAGDDDFEDTVHRIYPVIQPGDRIWVKEAWRSEGYYDDLAPSDMGGDEPIRYEADEAWQTWAVGWDAPMSPMYSLGRLRSSIHMPRWASRITLTVTDVRPQRVSEISLGDCYAEGCTAGLSCRASRCPEGRWTGPWDEYRALWNSIHGPDAWARNDWVWAYSFSVHHGNIDSMERQ
jgi:hypothetical protein